MAKKRELKKDIHALSELVISDALELSLSLSDSKKQEEALAIVVEVADRHNDLLSRVNHPDGKDNPKLVKKHFQAVMNDLLQGCDEAYKKLSELAK